MIKDLRKPNLIDTFRHTFMKLKRENTTGANLN